MKPHPLPVEHIASSYAQRTKDHRASFLYGATLTSSAEKDLVPNREPTRREASPRQGIAP